MLDKIDYTTSQLTYINATELSNYRGGVTKSGNFIELALAAKLTSNVSGYNQQIARIPSGYRPSKSMSFNALSSSNSGEVLPFYINSQGYIYYAGASSLASGTTIDGNVVYSTIL